MKSARAHFYMSHFKGASTIFYFSKGLCMLIYLYLTLHLSICIYYIYIYALPYLSHSLNSPFTNGGIRRSKKKNWNNGGMGEKFSAVSHNGWGACINGWVTQSIASYIMANTIMISPIIIAVPGKYLSSIQTYFIDLHLYVHSLWNCW